MGVDYGQRRIGLALSDATGMLARPWKTIPRAGNPSQVAATIASEAGALMRDDDGLSAIVVGLPRRLNGEPTDQTAAVEALVERLRGIVTIPVVLQDERLTSHEAERMLAQREKDWRKRKAMIDAAAAALILQDYLDQRLEGRTTSNAHSTMTTPESRQPPRKRTIASASRMVLRPGDSGSLAVGAWIFVNLERPFRGYDAPEQFVEIPAGTGSGSMGRRLAEAGVVRSATAFRAAVWMRGSSRRLQAGEYRFDQPMTTAQVVDKIARGDVYVRAITFREGLTNREMAALFESGGFGAAADFLTAARNVKLVTDLDPAARDLEGYLFPDTYTLQRKTTAAQLVERMVSRFRKTLTPEMREEAGARGFERASARHARVARRERNRQGGGATDRRRRVHEPPQDTHAAAVRSDRDLRDDARRAVRREYQARGSADGLAVQHLPISRAAARPDRCAR